ncbi:MAG: DUF1838 domain-containing protein [Alphaproteobacteria bacterium]|nr:DUF1838 domain-containing protein [Alphaproteobacteria bacterium]
MDFDALSRRHIGLFGALAALPAVPATAQTPRALPTAPRDILNTMVRIGGTSGKNRVTWKTRIIVYAVEPTGVRPLVGLRGSESAWWKKVDDDTFIRYSSTLSFFEDLETGKFIDEFKNPLTGAMNKVGVSFIRHKEGEYYTTKGEYFGTMKKAFPDVYKDEMPAPKWKLDGDVIRIQGDSNFPPILQQPTKEAATQFAFASEVFDPKVETPRGFVSGWNIRPWERWLDMGDRPGHVIWHFDGVKLDNAELHDRDYLERARAHTPLFDKSPEFDEGPSFFERVIQNRGVKPS